MGKAGTRKGLRFTHIELENWRNFRRMRADLKRRVFLIGPNASGKSNFLDTLRFLQDIVSIGGGLQKAVENRGGVSSLRALSARRQPDVCVRVNVGNDDDLGLWRYEIGFNQTKNRQLQVRNERVLRNGEVLLSRPDCEDEKDPERLSQTHLEQINMNHDFRGLAEFFRSVNYLHLVPQLVREPERSVGKTQDPFGGDFLEQVGNTPKNTRDSRFKRIIEALRIAVPQISTIQWDRDERGTAHLRGKYEHWRPQGAWQTEAHLSDGTLRLIGLLWSVLSGGGPLLLEEPELSLHPEIVRHLPQMFARLQSKTQRQVLISTHSSDLLRDEGLGLDEILLLSPREEGTEVVPMVDHPRAERMREAGIPVAEVAVTLTAPAGAGQLSLFNGF